MRREFETEQQRARTMVARLEMVSHGTTQSFDSDGRGGEGVRLFPPGGVSARDDFNVGLHSHVMFRRMLKKCVTEPDYAEVADAAEKELNRWRRAPRPGRDTPAWRERVGRDSRKASVVAKEYGISRQHVYNLRQAYQRKQEAA